MIVSLDLAVEYQGDELVGVSAASQQIYTTRFRKSSPKDYASGVGQVSVSRNIVYAKNGSPGNSAPEVWLGCVRRMIMKALERTCHDHDGKLYKVQPSDHTSHGLCKERKSIILLLPEKERCLRFLKMIGLDPYEK